ncbi:hypothetical protein ACJ41O_007318 [Fusarium nematophilum]
MSSTKRWATVLVALLSVPIIDAGPCNLQSSVSSSVTISTTAESTTATLSKTETTTTATLATTTASQTSTADVDTTTTTFSTATTVRETSTTSEAPDCTLWPQTEEVTDAPDHFNLLFDTCQGTKPNVRLGSGNFNGQADSWTWMQSGQFFDAMHIDSSGHVIFDAAGLIAVQDPNEESVKWVWDTVAAPRIVCHASTPDGGNTKLMRCTGGGNEMLYFQLCPDGPGNPVPGNSWVRLGPTLKQECEEVNLRIMELV